MNDDSPLEKVAGFIDEARGDQLAEMLAAMPPSELAHVVSRLDDEQRARLVELVPDDVAAALVQDIPLALASEMLSDLAPDAAASIVDRLPSDEQTDVLSSLDKQQALAVLAEMAPAEVEDVNRLSRFSAESAGGLMATEYLAYPATTSVADVVTDLRRRAADYAQYPVQYVYVIDGQGTLQGVVRLRDLLFHQGSAALRDLSLHQPITVSSSAGLNDLRDFFARNKFYAAPVVDHSDRLLGVVTRDDYEKASADQAARTLLRFGGIVIGEEFRSMPMLHRAGARLAWLAITMLLSFLAASVVGLYQDTLAQFIALAVFLPVISGMSGNAGNQSIAVTMRELSLGLVKPQEVGWVLGKELSVGLMNGIALGLTLALIAFLWRGDFRLGLVAGAAQALSVLLAVCLGGILPLTLKRLGFDPAVASAPVLTTITDATGFFLTLALASHWLRA